MKSKFIMTALALVPVLVFAQTSPNLLGSWKGIGNAAVAGADIYHPTEKDKEKSVRFTNMEFTLVVDREEGRNFTGYISSTSNKTTANADNKKMILGSYAKDKKSGVWVNDVGGSATFKLADSNILEVCYTHVSPKPMVADCLEMIKQ